MRLSMKKSLSLLLLVFVLALAFAVPAMAASKSYEFYYGGSSTSPYNSHVNGYIVGSADVTGTTVTITLSGDNYGDLQADDGSATFVTASKSFNGSGDSVFTFTNSSPTSDINTLLYVDAGPHSQTYPLTIHWN